jgi:acyl-CoA reductase-like NAD-dependent aldehyde dehydrogenase
MVQGYKLLIGGRWRAGASGETFDAVNPFNQEVWAAIPAATEEDVEAALAAARNAYETTWRHTSGLERATLINRLAALLDENADRMALLETTDNGKVIRETRSQMSFAARVFRFFAGYAAANEPQFRRILDYIEIAKKEGARLVTGGEPARSGELAKGLFIKPTIFADVDNTMRVAREEIFGPVLSVIPFEDEAQTVELGNATPFGLASGVWTGDVARAMRMIRAMRTGVVWVNTYRMVAAQAPFGGVKDSGYGRERGEQGLLEFITSKNVMIDFSNEKRDPFAVKT